MYNSINGLQNVRLAELESNKGHYVNLSLKCLANAGSDLVVINVPRGSKWQGKAHGQLGLCVAGCLAPRAVQAQRMDRGEADLPGPDRGWGWGPFGCERVSYVPSPT